MWICCDTKKTYIKAAKLKATKTINNKLSQLDDYELLVEMPNTINRIDHINQCRVNLIVNIYGQTV